MCALLFNLYRLNENFTLIQVPEPLIDERNLSLSKTVHQTNAAPVCELEALRVSCASRTPMGHRLSGLQRSSSDSSLATVENHLTSETSRYSCLELQPKCLFNETDRARPYEQDACFVSPTDRCAATVNCDMSIREVRTVMNKCDMLKAADKQQVPHKACQDIILRG